MAFAGFGKKQVGKVKVTLFGTDGTALPLNRHQEALLTSQASRLILPSFLAACRQKDMRALKLLAKNGARKLFFGKVDQLEKKRIISSLVRNGGEVGSALMETGRFSVRISLDGVFDLRDKIFLAKAIFHDDQYGIVPGMVRGRAVVDAGANIGIFSIYAAMLGAERVYAFEPVLRTYRMLVENIRLNNLNGKIIPINCALGREEGSGAVQYRYPGDGGASFVLKRAFVGSETARILTLDGLFPSNGNLGVVKIDSEGFEAEILEGGADAIKRNMPVLTFSAYHFNNDEKRLPGVVRGISANYSITVRNNVEKTIFCTPDN